MRRSVAIALLLLMLAAFLAPAALANAANPLPACCRAGGRHHCSAMLPISGGIQIRGQSCPYRKHLAFTASVAAPPVAATVAPDEARSFSNQFDPRFSISHRESPHSQRAPPPASSMK